MKLSTLCLTTHSSALSLNSALVACLRYIECFMEVLLLIVARTLIVEETYDDSTLFSV